jgi:FMN phosphatase YigB (HAD superfamily)
MSSPEQSPPIKAILFDLDGTLLRVHMSEFIPKYLQGLAAYCVEPEQTEIFIKTLLQSIRDLINIEGDGTQTNEERICRWMEEELAVSKDTLQTSLSRFKNNGIAGLQSMVHAIPLAQQIIQECLPTGAPLVLATNPVFPKFMIQARLEWGGLREDDFCLLTSYENSRYCKPQAGYFSDVAEHLGIAPENCLMVGNDTSHDLAASAVGMQTYLVDTWLVEREGPEWPCKHRGDHAALQRFLHERLY